MAIQYSDGEYIKIFRKMINWEWYTDINTKVLFLHCLLRANWKPGRWKGIQYERGQFITSLSSLSAETGLSIKMVRTALNHLIMTGEITSEGQGKGKGQNRIITVLNYDSYQITGKQEADEGQSSGNLGAKQGQQYKNIKNNKEYKEESEEPALAPVKVTRYPTGKYNNVFLSPEEAAKLQKEFPREASDMIEKLSEYMATKKTNYREDGHYAIILKWIREDRLKPKQQQAEIKPNKVNYETRPYTEDDIADIERKKLAWMFEEG